MKVLLTGSSGQIGTNLAHRLKQEGHEVFGVDKRQNTWTDDFRYLLQDLSGHYASFPGGINGVEYPRGGPRRASRRAREGAPARPAAAPCARERRDDVQRARVRPPAAHPDRLLVQSRGLRRRAPLRGVRRVDRRLRLHREHLLGLEDRRRGVHLLVRPLLRAAVSRLPLLERLRALRQRPAPHGARDAALHPRDAARRADHGLRRPREDARLHLRRRLRRRDRAAGSRRSPKAGS